MAERKLDPYKLTDTAENGCEGCHHCLFAGVRWPASPDGLTDLSYVDRCDYCELYDSDEEAAKALAEHFGVRWGYARRESDAGGDFPTDDDCRWEPPEDDGRDYTGWSCFIDHEARDGDPAYARDSAEPFHVALTLNPGQARAMLAAVIQYRIHIATEWASGEMEARALGGTLEALRDEVEQQIPTTIHTTGDDA